MTKYYIDYDDEITKWHGFIAGTTGFAITALGLVVPRHVTPPLLTSQAPISLGSLFGPEFKYGALGKGHRP